MENRGHNQFIEIVLLVVLAFLWGGSFTLIKIAVETVPPATIVLGRLIIGAALLLLLVKIKGLSMPTAPALWWSFLIQGFLQSALPFTLISWGEKYIDSGLAGLLNSTPPLFTFLISYVILRRADAPFRKFTGIIVGFAGVLITLEPDIMSSNSDNVWGQLAVTGSSISYAVAALYARRFSGQPALITAAGSMTMAALMMMPISIIFDRPWMLTPSIDALSSIAVLGIFSTAVAMTLYFRLVKTLGAIGVTCGSYLRAGFSVLLGYLFLEEALSANMMIGLVLITLSVAIVTGHIRFPRDYKKSS